MMSLDDNIVPPIFLQPTFASIDCLPKMVSSYVEHDVNGFYSFFTVIEVLTEFIVHQ